jgi:hypothetical protein
VHVHPNPMAASFLERPPARAQRLHFLIVAVLVVAVLSFISPPSAGCGPTHRLSTARIMVARCVCWRKMVRLLAGSDQGRGARACTRVQEERQLDWQYTPHRDRGGPPAPTPSSFPHLVWHIQATITRPEQQYFIIDDWGWYA